MKLKPSSHVPEKGQIMVFYSDIEQIDSPISDIASKRAHYLSDKMKTRNYLLDVNLVKGGTQLLAELASKLL